MTTMSCKLSLLLFLILACLFAPLASQTELDLILDDMPGSAEVSQFSRKHAALKPHKGEMLPTVNKTPTPQEKGLKHLKQGDKHGALRPLKGETPLPLNKTPAPQEKGLKHPKQGDKPIKSGPKPTQKREPKPSHPRKSNPSPMQQKLDAPAEKPSNRTKPAPAEKPSNRTKPAPAASAPQAQLKHPLTKSGTKGNKKRSTVKRRAPVKKHQCQLRRV